MKVEFLDDTCNSVVITRTRRLWPRFWKKVTECAGATWHAYGLFEDGYYVYTASGKQVGGSFESVLGLRHSGLQRRLISLRKNRLEEIRLRTFIPPPPTPPDWIPVAEIPAAKLLKP